MPNEAPEIYPDIEIYLHQVTAARIVEWLSSIFTNIELHRTGSNSTSLQARFQGLEKQEDVDILVVEDAQDGFTGLWFKRNVTPWRDDHECALAASGYFGKEIRCAKDSGAMTPEADEWYSLSADGESVITWSNRSG